VARLEKAWLDSNGALDWVAATLIDSPEAWEARPQKFKTPYEFVVSTMRALSGDPSDLTSATRALSGLGQGQAGPTSPEGWPDTAGDWATPDAIIKRMYWVEDLAVERGPFLDPHAVAGEVLGPMLSVEGAEAVKRAQNRAEGLAILLMSPEFQRR
jgi:uncharacterized protein (DUF1800 family)